MKKTNGLFLLLPLLIWVLAACEHANMDEIIQGSGTKVSFSVSKIEQVPFDDLASTRATEVSKVCTKIDLAIFKENEKITAVSQTSSDKDFGKLTVKLPEGTYQVVIIAHNGKSKATLSSADKITFPDSKVTDTFSYFSEIVVGEAETAYEVELKRVVAKFLFRINDAKLPDEVKQFKFYYTGGSSTLNATTGYGDVNSRQTEYRTIPAKLNDGFYEFEVFTFPHADGKKLNMRITAIDGSSTDIKEKYFEDIPVSVNHITKFTGTFFDSYSSGQRASFSLKVDDAWDSEVYSYKF